MAPALQGLFDVAAAKSGTVLCPACWCGVKTAVPDGIRGSGPYLLRGLEQPAHELGFRDGHELMREADREISERRFPRPVKIIYTWIGLKPKSVVNYFDT